MESPRSRHHGPFVCVQGPCLCLATGLWVCKGQGRLTEKNMYQLPRCGGFSGVVVGGLGEDAEQGRQIGGWRMSGTVRIKRIWFVLAEKKRSNWERGGVHTELQEGKTAAMQWIGWGGHGHYAADNKEASPALDAMFSSGATISSAASALSCINSTVFPGVALFTWGQNFLFWNLEDDKRR